jgi:anti-sigma B factor antagonist
MKIDSHEHGDALVIYLRGKVMGGPESADFQNLMKKSITDGKKKVVIDLGEVEWMNSSGIGLLVSAYTTVKNGGGELKIARTTDKIQSLLVITKLNSVFETYPDVISAVASYS